MTPADLSNLINDATGRSWGYGNDAVWCDVSSTASPVCIAEFVAPGNGRFIATARNTLPALLALWEAAEAVSCAERDYIWVYVNELTNALAALKDLKP